MCLIAVQKPGSTLSDADIRAAYSNNPDGLGIMVPNGRSVGVVKTMPKDAEECIRLIRTYADGRTAAIHFRFATHGGVDLDNCHPFRINDHVWLMHNGVLPIKADGDKSDTRLYVETYMRRLVGDRVSIVHEQAFIDVISRHIGNGNKFAVMSSGGEVSLYNRDQWHNHNGVWLSNQYSLVPAYRDYGSWADWTFASSSKSEAAEIIQFLNTAGYKRAAHVGKAQIAAFIKRFGVGDAWILVEYVDSGTISEKQFAEYVSDFEAYRNLYMSESAV